jgi:hypothetical protein
MTVIVTTLDSDIRQSMDIWLHNNCQSRVTAGSPPYDVSYSYYNDDTYVTFHYVEDELAFKLKFGV